jgi:hypothetical protein
MKRVSRSRSVSKSGHRQLYRPRVEQLESRHALGTTVSWLERALLGSSLLFLEGEAGATDLSLVERPANEEAGDGAVRGGGTFSPPARRPSGTGGEGDGNPTEGTFVRDVLAGSPPVAPFVADSAFALDLDFGTDPFGLPAPGRILLDDLLTPDSLGDARNGGPMSSGSAEVSTSPTTAAAGSVPATSRPHGEIVPFASVGAVPAGKPVQASSPSFVPATPTPIDHSGGSGGECELPPEVDAGPDLTVPEGSPVTVVASFTDPDGMGPYGVTVTWGDGGVDSFSLPGPTSFAVSHTYGDNGVFPVTVTVTDACGHSDSDSLVITVTNVAPSITGLTASSPVNENDTVWVSGAVTDPGWLDTETLTVNWGDGSPTETYFLGGGGYAPFFLSHVYPDDNPTGTPADDYTVTLTATDDDGGSSSASIVITVNNVAPWLSAWASSPVAENDVAVLTGNIFDPGPQDTFTLTVNWGDGSPTETFGYSAGATSFSLSHRYLDDDPTDTPADLYSVSLTLTDDDGGSTSTTTGVVVNNVSPTLSAADLSLSQATIDENGSVSLSGSFTDPGTLDTHTVAVDWGDGSAPDTLSLPAGVLSFGGLSHQYPDDDQTGTPSDQYPITVTVTDDDTGSGSATAYLTVNNVSPTLSNLSVAPVDEDGTATLSGTITDPGPRDTFTLTLTWGDGSPTETFSYGAGATSFSASHRYLDDDPTGTPADQYPISLTLTDDDTGSSTGSTQVTVNNVAPGGPTLTLTPNPIDENGTTSLSGSFTDPGTLDTHTVVVTWGDGSPAESFTLPAGVLSFGPLGHQYLDDDPTGTPSDTYGVTASVADDDTGSTAASTPVTVNNVAPTLSGVSATAIDEGGTTTLSGTITDPGTLDTFTLTVDWGDGSPAETFTYGAGATSFSVTHAYPDDNPTVTPSDDYAVSLTLTDDDTGTTTAGTTVTVSNVAPQVGVTVSSPIDEGGTATLSGTITDSGVEDTFTVVIDWGDGSEPETFTYPAGATSFSGSHQYLDDDPTGTPADAYSVTATVTDDDSGSGSAAASVTVNNVAPILSGVTASSPAYEGQGAAVSGLIDDPGVLDTFTLVVDWGDSSAPETFTYPAGTTYFSESHAYIDDNPTGTPADDYTVSLTLTDDDTGSDTASTTVTVSNVAPEFGEVSADSPIDENELTVLGGTFYDLGEEDTFTLTVDWGDGSSAETYEYGAGTTDFYLAHVYVDDNPTATPADDYTVALTLTDDDTGSTTTTTTVTVNNVAPVLSNVSITSPVNEGDPATLEGYISDASPEDTFTLVVDWGDGSAAETFTYPAGDQDFSLDHVYDLEPTDPPEVEYTVTLTLTDDDTGYDSTTVTVTVVNDACCEELTVEATISDPNPGPGEVGEPFTWDLSATYELPECFESVTSEDWEWTVLAVWTKDDEAADWEADPEDQHDVTIADSNPADSEATLEATFWLPGLKQIEVRATLNLTGVDDDGDEIECEGSDDKADEKVVPGVVLEKPDAKRLPKGGAEDNTVKVTAKAVGGIMGTFKFTLFDVSSLPGYAMNAPLKPPATGEDSATWKDLQFPEQAGWTITGDNKEVATNNANNLKEAEVTVKAFDYGAYGKIKVELAAGGKTYEGVEKDGKDKFTRLPVDANDNKIGDAAPQDKAGGEDAKDDKDNKPELNKKDGDGLTRFEEYRGFLVSGKHVRTSVEVKTLFVSNKTGHTPTDKGSIFAWLADVKIELQEVTDAEYNDKREVNFNRDASVADAKAQRAVVVENQANLGKYGETLGELPSEYKHVKIDVARAKRTVKLAAPIKATDDKLDWIAYVAEPGNALDSDWRANGRVRINDEVFEYTEGWPRRVNPGETIKTVAKLGKDETSILVDKGFPDVDHVLVKHEEGVYEVIKTGAYVKGYDGTLKVAVAANANPTELVVNKGFPLLSGGADKYWYVKVDAEWFKFTDTEELGDGRVKLKGVSREQLGSAKKEHKVDASVDLPFQWRASTRRVAGDSEAREIAAGTEVVAVGLLKGVKRKQAGTDPGNHKAGDTLPFFVSIDDAIRNTVAHEVTHVLQKPGTGDQPGDHFADTILENGQSRGSWRNDPGKPSRGLYNRGWTEDILKVLRFLK